MYLDHWIFLKFKINFRWSWDQVSCPGADFGKIIWSQKTILGTRLVSYPEQRFARRKEFVWETVLDSKYYSIHVSKESREDHVDWYDIFQFSQNLDLKYCRFVAFLSSVPVSCDLVGHRRFATDTVKYILRKSMRYALRSRKIYLFGKLHTVPIKYLKMTKECGMVALGGI